MKNRSIFSLFTLIVAILGLFAACTNPAEPIIPYSLPPASNYTVSFEANGGSPAPNPQSIAQGGKVVQPPAMTKTGYGFGGWYKEAACTNQWNFATDTVSGTITLYAKWGVNYYTVSFNANSGSPAPNPQNIAYGGQVVQPPAMTKTGYGFGGWYKEAACTNQWDFAADTVTGTITLYAQWNSIIYTVNFEANGGSPAPDPQTIAYGGKVVQPPAMTKTGYGFGGWYKEAACTNQWNFATDTVTGTITLYAKWLVTVSFNADGGTPSPPQQTIISGGKVSEPANISKEGCTLSGWYTDASYSNLWDFDSDTVTNDIILYAKWGPPIVVSGDTLAAKLQWLSTHAASNSIYILEVTAAYENLVPQNLSYTGKNNITIRLKGIGSEEVIALSGDGSLFTIGNGVTLILDDHLTLSGKSSNTASLVRVDSCGTLIMNQGVQITGNTFSSGYTPGSYSFYGGGVYVSGGTFIMSGGEISGNISGNNNFDGISSYGGGVYVDGGTFTMSGGKISGNTSSSSYSHSYGGGVYVVSGTFTMSGGEISGNTSSSSSFSAFGAASSHSYGGGVYVDGGTFTMSGGKISGNTSSSSYSCDTDNHYSYAHFSYSYGGGVYVGSGTFTMSGGEISGNTSLSSYYSYAPNSSSDSSYSYGGGVYVDGGTFTMSDGKISGNTSSSSSSSLYTYPYYPSSYSYGGGVCVRGGIFAKSGGGTITGYASDTVNGNVVKKDGVVQSNSGHAVNVDSSRRRERTAGPGVNLDSRVSGAAGGWE